MPSSKVSKFVVKVSKVRVLMDIYINYWQYQKMKWHFSHDVGESMLPLSLCSHGEEQSVGFMLLTASCPSAPIEAYNLDWKA